MSTVSSNDTINSGGETINGENDTITPTNDTIKSERNDFSEVELSVLRLIADNNSIDYRGITSGLAIFRSTAIRYIRRLVARGVIVRQGSRKTGSWQLTDYGYYLCKREQRKD